MRTSKYNIYSTIKGQDNKRLVIQGARGSFDVMDKEIVEVLKKGETDSTALEALSAENLEILKGRGYVTEASPEAEFEFIEKVCLAMNKVTRRGISVTLLPTYNCNFRCEYCFERNLQEKGDKVMAHRMPDTVINAVFEQLKKYQEEGKKIESIYLFGGEPLLRTNKPIVEYICNKARELSIPICCISNGYDLDEYIDLIREYQFSFVQITIDGRKETHDARRYLAGGQGTFDRILDNVSKALDAGVTIALRTNVNKKNVEQIGELIDLYKEKNWIGHPRFKYYFKSTIRCYEQKENELSEIELMQYLSKLYGDTTVRFDYNSIYGSLAKNIKNMLEKQTFAPMRSGYCGANMGMYTVDPNGDIYPCWDVLTESECVIGHVNVDEGTFEFNGSHDDWKERTVDKLTDCKQCRYMLFCGGGCSAQAKVLHQDINKVFCDDFQQLFDEVVSEVCGEYLEERNAAKNEKGGNGNE